MAIDNDGVVPYNRGEELKAFDDTKIGVKGLLDSGVSKVPKIFVSPSNEIDHNKSSAQAGFQIPVIDLQGEPQEVVDKIKSASEQWGFFQVVNHGVPLDVLDEMVKGVIRFHEGDEEVKKQYCSRDPMKKVRYNTNFDLYQSKTASWRDTLLVYMLRSELFDPNELPSSCRDITVDFIERVTAIGDTICELLSQALGLKEDYLNQIDSAEFCTLALHYYPACPEPDKAFGITKHTDASFLTILVQDHIGGLQVLYQDDWVDVQPIPGALIVNIGDFLQIISNDKFKSVVHRVLANSVETRVSVACFLNPRFDVDAQIYGPVKNLISEGDAPVYKEFTAKEYIDNFYNQGPDGNIGLDTFKL